MIAWALYYYIILLTATFLLSLLNKIYFWPFLKYKQKYLGHFHWSFVGNKTVPETSGILLCKNRPHLPCWYHALRNKQEGHILFTPTTQKFKATFPLSTWKSWGGYLPRNRVWTTCLSFYPGSRHPTLAVPSNHKKGVRCGSPKQWRSSVRSIA